MSRRYQLTGRKFRAGLKQPKNGKYKGEQIKMHAARLRYMNSERLLLLSIFFFSPDRAGMDDSASAYYE